MAQPTQAQLDDLLTRFQYNLELILDYYDTQAKEQKLYQLTQYILTSISFIEREGITLDFDDTADCELIVMYASWIYDKRKDGVAIMPRMLRYNLNNRLFSQRVKP